MMHDELPHGPRRASNREDAEVLEPSLSPPAITLMLPPAFPRRARPHACTYRPLLPSQPLTPAPPPCRAKVLEFQPVSWRGDSMAVWYVYVPLDDTERGMPHFVYHVEVVGTHDDSRSSW